MGFGTIHAGCNALALSGVGNFRACKIQSSMINYKWFIFVEYWWVRVAFFSPDHEFEIHCWTGQDPDSIRSQLSSHSRSRRRHSLRFFIEPAQALLISFKHFPIDWRSQIQSIKIIESLFRNLAGIELKFNLVENPLKRCAKRRRFGNQSFYHMGVIYMQIARMIDCDLSHGAWNRSKFA